MFLLLNFVGESQRL